MAESCPAPSFVVGVARRRVSYASKSASLRQTVHTCEAESVDRRCGERRISAGAAVGGRMHAETHCCDRAWHRRRSLRPLPCVSRAAGSALDILAPSRNKTHRQLEEEGSKNDSEGALRRRVLRSAARRATSLSGDRQISRLPRRLSEGGDGAHKSGKALRQDHRL